MTDKEKVLKRLKDTSAVLTGKNTITNLDFQIRDMVEDCIRVIQTQQEEIEILKQEKATAWEEWNIINEYCEQEKQKYKTELEKKDETIDAMANFILVLVPNHCYDEKPPALMDIDWVKEYFINKVEKEKK